jgi:DNA-binding NtrC family response regulator
MKPLVLIVDDEKSFRTLYSQTVNVLDVNVITVASGEDALELIKNQTPNIVISDVRMTGINGIELLKKVKENFPDLPFLLVTAYASIRDAVSSLKYGAIDYLEKPIDLDELQAAVGDILNIRKGKRTLEFPNEAIKGIIAESPVMLNLLNDAYRVAKSDITVLITGESGTGKEVVSQFIHNNSDRAAKSIVTLNCASIPSNLLNSELFGHKKGSFTGATTDRLGKFREAQDGTLFLDEIGDMPLELQASLLRAIEYQKISPVGSDKELSVDVRLIAATNKLLDEEVENGNFREDLFYRLNVITLEIPPLSQRQEDIVPLARYFLKTAEGQNKRLSANTIRVLQNYSWPGNVRELANAMKRAKILSRTELIMPEHLPPNIRKTSQENSADNVNRDIQTIEQTEKVAIMNALEKTKGNQTKAADLLGISRRTLINKVKKYNF